MYVINRRAVWVVAVGALVVALATASVARADTTTKPYSVGLTYDVPNDVAASGSTVTATFTNENTTQQLGSADLSAPSGYVISKATTSQGTSTVAHNVVCPTGTPSDCVELRNLALMPRKSLTVTIVLTSSNCVASNWSVVAKQSNDFSGVPGNDLTLDTANSNLNTSVCTAPCKKNAVCTTDGSNPNGDANVAALKSISTGNLFESVNPSSRAPLTCENPNGSDYLSDDQNTYGVFATADRAKVVTITIPKASIPLAQQQVCFDAPYTFVTTSANLLPDGNGGFTGLLPDCKGALVGPCHDRSSDSVSGSTVTLVVDIPSGLPGDPHMN